MASGGSNVIEKVSFVSDGDATDVGDSTATQDGRASSMSETYGYTQGGSPSTNIIEKYSFASDANATDVGNLLVNVYLPAGAHDETHSWTAGGRG